MHIPVMLNEALFYLDPRPGKTIVDCTLGFGGHAAALLDKGAKLIGIEQDEDAIDRLSGDPRIKVIRGNFKDIKEIIRGKVDGFLFDLGVSSYQIDSPERGFSIRTDGPLDMRMDKSAELTAAEIVNHYSKEELKEIFQNFGEERFSGRIASAIIKNRPLTGTLALKEIIEKAIPTWRKRESVTRIFQALRIAVNDELNNLKSALEAVPDKLKRGGRVVVISYHSLEDRIVKRSFKNGILKALTKKPVTAGEEEVQANPRARSAKLRAAEKI